VVEESDVLPVDAHGRFTRFHGTTTYMEGTLVVQKQQEQQQEQEQEQEQEQWKQLIN